MCGYVQQMSLEEEFISELFGLTADDTSSKPSSGTHHAYPSFGRAPKRLINAFFCTQGGLQKVDPVWWFDCTTNKGDTIIGERTTFNARNLNSVFWAHAVRHQRGVVIAHAIGESEVINGKRTHHLIYGQQPLLLGALIKPLDNGDYCCAIITQPPSLAFSHFHAKAQPLLLPSNQDILQAWLATDTDIPPEVQHVLSNPEEDPHLTALPVQSFHSGKPLGIEKNIGTKAN